jgi:hypothetical protein
MDPEHFPSGGPKLDPAAYDLTEKPALVRFAMEEPTLRGLLVDIHLQATRKDRAGGMRRRLANDLEIIAEKAATALELLSSEP